MKTCWYCGQANSDWANECGRCVKPLSGELKSAKQLQLEISEASTGKDGQPQTYEALIEHIIGLYGAELEKANAEIARLRGELSSIRDEAVALVDARKLLESVLHVESPKRIKDKANAALRGGISGVNVHELLNKERKDGEDLAEHLAVTQAALADLFAMMDEGLLVRDTSGDLNPNYFKRALDLTTRLAKAYAALPAET